MFESFYRRLTGDVVDKVTNMKNIKAPTMVDNFNWMHILGIGERAKKGLPLYEPLGATINFRGFETLMLVPAQMYNLPLGENEVVNTRVTLGKKAARPLSIEIPIMISAMAYGPSVHKGIKVAQARAATAVGTAANSGEGGFLSEERRYADRYIVQYNRAKWNNRTEQLRQADMIEIRIGQGASVGDGFRIPADQIDDELREYLGLEPGQDAVMPNTFPEIQQRGDWKQMVDNLREITEGVPIAVKFGAGDIERDLETALEAGVDVVVIDGAQGNTAGSLQTTINHFGVPLLYALVRADRYLQETGARDRVSLVACGGFRDAGDVLKAMALGVDAVYMGYASIVAMTYSQFSRLKPGTSPMEMVLYEGDQKGKFNIDEGAENLTRYLQALAEEMVLAARALGKDDLAQINRDDLVALDPEVASITGTRLAYLN